MEQRHIEFKALFRNIRTGKTCWQHCNVNHKIDTASFVQVSPWCQYSGIKNCSEKMIFEGDTVEYAGETGTVIFKDGSFNVTGFCDTSQDYPCMAFSEGSDFEIIGNIHDVYEEAS